MSLKEMASKLQEWRNNPNTLLDLPVDIRSQMLATMDQSVASWASNHPRISLASDSTLCSKKGIIIDKFNALLKRLGSEELALNITDDKVNSEYKAALEAWLDSESEYRLTVSRQQQAQDGADYAQQQYEKYDTAYKTAKETKDRSNAQNVEELAGLQSERDLILQIMQMIGVLQSANATAPAALTAKVNALQSLAVQAKTLRVQQMARRLRTQLDQFTESGEVAQILKQMIQDIEDRMRILNNLNAQTADTADSLQTKLIEWQTKLVDLSDAADKAKAASESAELQRERLAGQKKVAEATATNEKAAYKLTISPYLKEIHVIQIVKQKILDHCAQVS